MLLYEQGDNTNWSQAALQAQAQALAQLQLQLAGNLDQNAAAFLPTSPRNALGAFAQQQLVQQHLQSLSLQQSAAALLAQVCAELGQSAFPCNSGVLQLAKTTLPWSLQIQSLKQISRLWYMLTTTS